MQSHFAIAGSGFERPVVEVINSTAARSGLVMAVSRTMPRILVSSGSLLVWYLEKLWKAEIHKGEYY